MPQTLMQLRNEANLASKPRLFIYSPSHDSHSFWQKWLPNFEWQSSVQLSQIRQWLLQDSLACLLVDMRHAPQRMLSEINHLKENFNTINIIAMVDQDHLHIGRMAASQGADAYVCSEHMTGVGLNCVCESLMQHQHSDVQLVSNSSGLMNYALYYDRLNHALQLAKRHKNRSAILLVSINQFSLWAQKYDDVMQDTMLNQFAESLLKQVRTSDSLTYLQQGLFGIILEGLQDEVMAAHIARKVQQRCTEDLTIEGQVISLGCCVGVYVCETGELNGEALHQQAFSALSRAQQKDSKGLWFYGQDINSKVMARFNIEKSLQRALEKDEFFVQYQPCHTSKGKIVNVVQPLMRWMHPSSGVVLPDAFSHLLEASESLNEISFWFIDQVLEDVSKWQKDGHWSNRQQVLLPMNQRILRMADIAEQLQQNLAHHNVSPEQVIIQLDERTVLENLAHIKELLTRIPGLSLSVELEAIQASYRSLAYLKDLDVEFVCLNRDFFKHLFVDQMQSNVVKNITHLAHELGIDVLAFGADNPVILEKMLALGCDGIAGEYFTCELNAHDWPEYLLEN